MSGPTQSSFRQSHPAAEAREIASEVMALLGDSCDRMEIAGSVRRKAALVGDVEICFQPKFALRQCGLFDLTPVNLEFELAQKLRGDGVFIDRRASNGSPCFGPAFQRILYKGMPVDLFGCIEPADWGIMLLIRTGPRDFSKRFVTSTLFGGWMPPGMRQTGGFQLMDRGAFLDIQTEEAYFEAIGRAYIAPEDRR